MISIKKYLRGGAGNNATEEGLRQVVSHFVHKFAETAVEGDPRDLEDFRKEIISIHENLTPDLPLDKVLIFTGAATKALEIYNRRVTRTIVSQSGDLRAVLKLLQDHLAALAGANSDSVERLGELGKEMEDSEGFKTLGDLKLHLARCLSGLREEIEREKTSSKALIEKLQIDVEGFRGLGANAFEGGADPATGLPRQGECLTAIQAAIDKGTRHYTAVMVVSRVQAINARFGRDAGDKMLRKFKETVHANVVAPDQLFRWTGPAMVAIMERPQPIAIVRIMAKRMFDVRAEETFHVGGRTVMVPISASWAVFGLEATLAATEKHIQTFVASQGSRDFA